MPRPARVKNQIKRRPIYLIIGGECHYLQYSNVYAWKDHLGCLDAERANIETQVGLGSALPKACQQKPEVVACDHSS